MEDKDRDFKPDFSHFRQKDSNHSFHNVRNEKAKKLCIEVFTFFLHHLSLMFIVFGYIVLGAFIFQFLEIRGELKNCYEGKAAEDAAIKSLKQLLIQYIQNNVSTNPLDLTKDNQTAANTFIENELMNFGTNTVLSSYSSYKYAGQPCDTANAYWRTANSILFAITIITTIGYGSPITPSTQNGQIACICYALIGIPIFIMFITNISGQLSSLIRLIYSRVCCRPCAKKNSNDKVQTKTSSDVIQQTTEENGKARVIDDMQDLENEIKSVEEQDVENVSVPLTITMIIITFYVVLGAAYFNYSESWNFSSAAYFCFVTIATIGFGDLVPGQAKNDPNMIVKLCFCYAYIILGLAVLGMCFDLMQEEIIAKFTWVGKKLGIVEEEDEEDEEYEENEENEQNNQNKNKAELSKEEKQNKILFENDRDDSKKEKFELNTISPAPSYHSREDDPVLAREYRIAYLENLIKQQKGNQN